MKSILVPLDGSHAATKALDVAFDLAEMHGAALKLLHILLHDKEPDELLRLPGLDGQDGIRTELTALTKAPRTEHTAEELMSRPNLPDRPSPDSLLTQIGEVVLGQAADQAEARSLVADRLSISDGAPGQVIVETVKAEGIDTIVMGMRGLSQIEAFTFGSVSQEVCRSTGCTCIAVH